MPPPPTEHAAPDPDSKVGKAYAWLRDHPKASSKDALAAGFNHATLYFARHWLAGKPYKPPARGKAAMRKARKNGHASGRTNGHGKAPAAAQVEVSGLPIDRTTIKAMRSMANLTGTRTFVFRGEGVEISVNLGDP